jgi:hypothetical protein
VPLYLHPTEPVPAVREAYYEGAPLAPTDLERFAPGNAERLLGL